MITRRVIEEFDNFTRQKMVDMRDILLNYVQVHRTSYGIYPIVYPISYWPLRMTLFFISVVVHD